MSEVSEGDLLPSNSTAWERDSSLVIDHWPKLRIPATDIRGVKLRPPQPESFRPFIVWEYGLGGISRFFASEIDCIAAGIPWERVRGTQDAIDKALAWVPTGYSGVNEPFPARRRRWNNFHLALNKVRDAEEPDLNDIEYLTQFSVAERSRFWRGFSGYDVRAVDFSYSRWSNAIWSDDSGARIRTGGAKWSFGRSYERDYTPTQADLTALGVWQAENNTGLSWGAFTWQEPGVTWGSSPASTRSRLMASGVLAKACWFRFRAAGGAIIGHRRARVFRAIAPDPLGVYSLAGSNYTPQNSTAILYAEALTDFGDGYSEIVLSDNSIPSTAGVESVVGTLSSPPVGTQWSLLFDPTVVAPTKVGALYASADQLTGGVEIMPTAANIEFGRTVRERFKAILRF